MLDTLAILKQQGWIMEFCSTVAEWYNSESLSKPDNIETCTKGMSWLFIASYFSIWYEYLLPGAVILVSYVLKGWSFLVVGGRGTVRVKFSQVTRPWNSDTRLDEMNELVPQRHGLLLKMPNDRTVQALLMDTLVRRKLYLRPPSQNAVFLNSHTNSVFLHSRKQPAPVTGNFFASWGCPLTRASSVFEIQTRDIQTPPSEGLGGGNKKNFVTPEP